MSGDVARALVFVVPVAMLMGYSGAKQLAAPSVETGRYDLEGRVTHIRDGDTIEVAGVPIRIANLDCAERGTRQGNAATDLMYQFAAGTTAICKLEGRRSYDREVGLCSIPNVGDVGEAMIRAGACERWRW